ncbi:MAG: enoyl-CoA hydratase-related protein [Pseudoxanthomonas sp.]|nr:enoyl-CoA hydratase-related protein [Pseudoxanthomonas sp.]
MTEPVLTEIDEGVATLTLNRPRVHNAFDDVLVEALTEALKTVESERAVRAVVLTGEGASFSAGADLNWMRRMVAAGEKDNRKDARRLAKLMRTLNQLAKPTVARVNGPAYGGGVGLVACCDIAIAAKEAKFGLTEVRLGLVPAAISPHVIDAIGGRQARRWFLTGEIFDAEAALRMGLVHQVVPARQLDAAVDAQLALLRGAGPEAVVQAKALVQRVVHPDGKARRSLDEDNADLIARLRVSPEGQEGLTAFLAKRRPAWQ